MVFERMNKGDSILDFGCGIGDFSQYLEDKKFLTKYLGVDINPNFIKFAKESYPDRDFQTIKDLSEIKGKWDVVCAIGVFTWYISKEEFIESIHTMYDLCNKKVILTLLHGDTPYGGVYGEDKVDSYDHDQKKFWDSKYRFYDEWLFRELFPDFNLNFKNKGVTLLIEIIKN